MPVCAHATTFLNGQCPGSMWAENYLKICFKKRNLTKIFTFCFAKIDFIYFFINSMNPPCIFSFVLKKSNMNNIIWNWKTWWCYVGRLQGRVIFVQYHYFHYQRIDKVALNKCPFNAHCPMGNARDTKFLNGHCLPLPMPSFFLMGIAHVCPCPKIVPVTHH